MGDEPAGGRRRRREGARRSGSRASVLLEVVRSADLRRLELAWGAYFLVDSVTLVALSVWAYEDGGASAVGVLGLMRLVPGALALPFGAWAADRVPRRLLVVTVFSGIATTTSVLACVLLVDGPALVVYGLVALNSVAAAPYRPAQLALVPLVARSPEELVAINVASGTVCGLATFVGPAAVAPLLAAADPWSALAAATIAAVGGLVCVMRIDVTTDPSRAERRLAERPLVALLGGVRELRGNADMAVIVWCFIMQLIVRGMLGVLTVEVAFDLVDLGRGGVGWLAAAMGAGGILGAAGAVGLAGRRRLGRPFAVALFFWGAPIAVIGLAPHPIVAITALLTIGVGDAVLDVAGFTMLQRLGRDRALGRVFGVFFTVGVFLAGVVSPVVAPLASWLGLRPVLVGTGLLLPTLAVVVRRRFASMDARAEPPSELVGVLAAVPFLAPLPPTTIEKLAARSVWKSCGPGESIVVEGGSAGHFYAIVDGQVEVTQGGVPIGLLGPGEQFGEIALLRGSVRTATVTTTCPTRLVEIDGAGFVDALSSSDAASALGWQVAEGWLARSVAKG